MKTLLLLIDLQQGWRHEQATEQVFLNTVELAKHFEGDVIHCCFKNDRQSSFVSQLGWNRFFKTTDTDQIPEITPLKLPIYWRSTYNCITDETLPIIKQYDAVYIAGVFTDVSVAVTAMAVFDLGIPVRVVKDCVATLHGEDIHDAMLNSLGFSIGARNLIPSSVIMSPVQQRGNSDK